jgi:hypothetical protein
MTTPYNTGKVLIGSNYHANPSKPKYVEYDTDMLLLQHALVGDTKQYRRDKLLWRIYVAVIGVGLFILLLAPTLARADAIATMPNEGGGFIVLTDDPCKHEGKVYKGLNRLYSYTARGNNFEGCYGVEDDTVVAIWYTDGVNKRRYPVSSFTLSPKRGTRYGT